MSLGAWMTVLGIVGREPAAPPAEEAAFSSPPVVAWVHPLPAPPNPSPVRAERGAPALRDGLLYLGASQDNSLLVLDAQNGALKARLPASGPVQSAPVLGEELVWFSDTAGYTWCYRIRDGEKLWSHYSGAPLLSSPLVSGGRVYLSNVDDVVFALDAFSGELAWRHAQQLDPGRGIELELFGAPSPALAGELLLTGHSDGTLLALNASDGELAWQRRVGEGRYPDLIAPAMGTEEAILVAGYTAPLLALDLSSQAVRWRLDDVGAAEALVRRGDDVYVAGVDGKLRAVNLRTGELRWTWDSGTGGSLAEPVVTEAGLLVGAAVGGLALVDRDSGATIWTLDLGHQLDGVSGAPLVSGDEAWVVTNAGNLVHLVVPSPPPPPPRLRATGERAPR